ncbi:MAG TPA: ribosome maturation factor RimM [Telluria sp.]|nr:ribosome maturation factor RimM [Telluria sp.]
MTTQASSGEFPGDLVQVGFISGAFGVVGGLRVRPFSDDADALLKVKRWWLDKPTLHEVKVRSVKPHSGELVATLVNMEDRDVAEALKGAGVYIARSQFPALPENEFYWTDLIGLNVVNLQGEALGTVTDMMHNGAQSILRITPVEAGADERLVPFVDAFVKNVDLPGKTVTVDWGLDF